MVNSLRKRSGPGLTYSIIGNISLGEVVSVYEEVDGWFRLDATADVWCSGAANYMQRLPANSSETTQVRRAQCIVRALYLREGPGKNHKIIGNLVRNDVVTVYEVKNGWYRISPTKQVWCSGESQYMKVLA